MPRILESEALALAQNIDSLDDTQKPQALDILTRYKQQQDDFGEPEWPTQSRQREGEELRFRSMFEDLANVDKAAPSLVETLQYSDNPDADRARVASIAYLSRHYGKDSEEIGGNLDLYKNDFATKRGTKGNLDDLAFYRLAASDVAETKLAEDTRLEGAKAALRGEDVIGSLQAWQGKNLDRLAGSTDFTKGYLKAKDQAGDYLPMADELLKLMESQTGQSNSAQTFDTKAASRLDELAVELAGMKPRERKLVYASLAARSEMAGYEQKGFWSQMLGELDKGLLRMSSTVGTTAGNAADVMRNFPAMLAEGATGNRDFGMKPGEVANTDETIAQRQALGEIHDELASIVSGTVDPVRPTIGWLNDTVETGLIKGPGAVAPFMAASALLGPYGAGLLFTADFAEQNRRDLRAAGMDNDRAIQIGTVAAPLQAAVESLSNMLQLGKFTKLQSVLANFTKPIGGGAGLALRYAQNTGISLATEYTEEQLQDNFIVPAVQEIVGALASDVPEVDWSFYKTRAAESTPELLSVLAPMALVFGGVMTGNQANLSREMTSNIDALKALNYSEAQATEIVAEKTEEGRIAKASSMWRVRAGDKTTLEEGARSLSERMRQLSGDVVAQQQELERRGILPRMLRATEDQWRLTFQDGSTAAYNSHAEADAARWTWTEDQLGKIHALTRETLSSMERNLDVKREIGVEFSPDARTAQDAVNDGISVEQMSRRVKQGAALGDVAPDTAFDDAQAIDKATADSEGFLSSLRILGSSRNEFKDGVLRTTIRLWEGSNVLTLVEEKLEGDAKAIISERRGRDWMLSRLRAYEETSGDKLFRDVPDEQLKDDDIIEAWSHLGQSYLVGRSTFGEPLQAKTMRRFGRLLMRAGFTGAMNSEASFFAAVASRAKKLGELQKAGKLGADLTAELEKQLGIDSQVAHEAGTEAEARQLIDTSGYSEETPGPNGETFSTSRATPADASNVVQMPDGARLVGPTTFSIRAYHGTPHKVAKFSLDKIGTGEGAQAYGWGLYFAEARDVAKQYQDSLAHRGAIDLEHEGRKRGLVLSSDTRVELIRQANNTKKDDLSAARALQYANVEARAMDINALAEIIAARRASVQGNLYTVELLPDADEFLDWDKPLSEQSEKVKAALASVPLQKYDKSVHKDPRAVDIYSLADSNPYGGDTDSKASAEALLKAGIPGIRFLDGNSRDGGSGTSNYVIFDENLVRILEENGQPVANETFSLRVTPAQDAEYMAAVEVGDMEKAQRMVDEAVRAAGYNSETLFRGRQDTGNVVSFGKDGAHFTPVREYAEGYAEGEFGNVVSGKAKIIKPLRIDLALIESDSFETFKAHLSNQGLLPSTPARLFEWSQNPKYNQTKTIGEAIDAIESDSNWADFQEDPSSSFTDNLGSAIWPLGFDAIRTLEHGNRELPVVILKSPSQIKSADPITRDADGNVIPLSQRFNPERNEITFSLRSGDFAKWFKDSKIIEADGSPKIVYHGSPDVRPLFSDGFKAFSRGSVFFAAADYAPANTYADPRRAFDFQNADEGVIPLYLSIQNPMEIDAGGKRWRETERFVKEAKDSGYDGIIIRNVLDDYNTTAATKPTTVYAWFTPSQAKSALTEQMRSRLDKRPIAGALPNSGGFDANDPRLSFSLRSGDFASRAAAMFSPFQRTPELRMAIARVAKERVFKVIPQLLELRGELNANAKERADIEIRFSEEMAMLRTDFEADEKQVRDERDFELKAVSQDKGSELDRERLRRTADKKLARLRLDYERTAAEAEKRKASELSKFDKKDNRAQRDRIKQLLRVHDALLSAIPAEVRPQVGGYVRIAELNTDEKAIAFLEDRVQKMEKVLEKWLKKEYLQRIAKLFKRFAPKKDDKGRITSNITAEAAEDIGFAFDFASLDDANQEKEMAAIEKTLEESEDAAEIQDAIGKLAIVQLFHKLENRESSELAAAATWLDELGSGAREARKIIDAARAEQVKEAKDIAKADASNGKLSSLPDAENVEADVRSSTFKRFTNDVKGFLNSALFTMGHQLEIVFGQDSRITTEFHRRAVRAANDSTDIKRDIEARRAAFVANHFGTTSRIKQAGRMGALTVPTASGVIIETGGKTKTIDVPAEIVVRIIEGTADLKALGFTSEEASTLADAWADNGALPVKRQKRVFQIERRSDGKDVELTMSQDEAIQYLLWSSQKASREQMERDGWSAESFQQLSAFLSDDAKALAKFFAEEYARMGRLIEPVYRRMFHAPFPQVDNYSPIFRDISKADSIIDIDQQGHGSGVSSGFILARNKNARSALRRTSAISAFMQHAESASHWIAHVELVRDLRSVLIDKEVQNAIRSSGRTAAANGIKKRVMQLENQGKVGAAGIAELDSWGSRLLQARAFKGLAWRISPVMKQASAYFNPLLADVPAWDYMRGTARLLSGQLDVSAMWNSPDIQRRIVMGFSAEARIAMDKLGYTGSTLLAAMGKGMLPMQLMDAGWTTAGAAVAFDYYRRNNIKSGMNEAQAESAALDQLEMMIAESAQPADPANRSLIEGLQNPWLKSMWMFSSESRKTLAVEIMALRRLATGKSKNKAMDVQRAVVAHVIMATTTQLMAGVLSLLMGDDDDREREWSVEEWVAAIAAGPINGLFLFGDAFNYIGRRLFGLHAFEPSTAIGQAVKTVSSTPSNIDKVINGEPEEQRKAFLKLGEAVGQAAFIVGPGNPFTAADVILGNPLKDADKILARLTD